MKERVGWFRLGSPLLVCAAAVAGLVVVVRPAIWQSSGEVASTAITTTTATTVPPPTTTTVPPPPPPPPLVFFSREVAGNLDIDVYVMKPDGSELRRLTDDPGHDFGPRWAPAQVRVEAVP